MPPETTETELASSPTWMTKDYLQDKLRKRYNNPDLQIINLQNKLASSKGENYTSELIRAKLSFRLGSSAEIHNLSIIVKNSTSCAKEQLKIMNEYGFYRREMRMYEEILPKLQAILGTKVQISPSTIYVDYDHDSIIFEDLSEKGFIVADRLERLDREHALLALSKIAKLHASAAVLYEKTPSLFKKDFDRGMFNRHTRSFEPMVLGILSAMIRYVEKQPELKKLYSEKLLALRERIMEYCERVFDVKTDHFMTLNHGDFWHMNMMFKYDPVSHQPIDVVPLDYQCSAWASPAVDLHYFFNTSLKEELRVNEQQTLVQHYYKTLVETLRELNYQGCIPSLFEFRMQIEVRSFYGFFATFIFQPIMICPDTKEACFLNLISDNEVGTRFKDTLFKNVNVQTNIEKLLPTFERMGLLDNMDSMGR